MASGLIVMASNLLVMDANLIAMCLFVLLRGWFFRTGSLIVSIPLGAVETQHGNMSQRQTMVGGLVSLTLIMGRARERVRILAGVAASGLLVRCCCCCCYCCCCNSNGIV